MGLFEGTRASLDLRAFDTNWLVHFISLVVFKYTFHETNIEGITCQDLPKQIKKYYTHGFNLLGKRN